MLTFILLIVPPLSIAEETVPKSETVAPWRSIVDAPFALNDAPFKFISHSFIWALSILLSGLAPVMVAPAPSTNANFSTVPKSEVVAPVKSTVPPENNNLDPVTFAPVTIFALIVLIKSPPVVLAEIKLDAGLSSEF